jgi:hypothetical protein
MTHNAPGRAFVPFLFALLAAVFVGAAARYRIESSPKVPIDWKHLSSTTGELAVPPGGSTQQTGAVVADFDRDGVNDFIVSFRQKPPALVWYRRAAAGWDLHVIEREYLTVEAGGAVHDIDGDGDLDLLNKPYTWGTPRIDVWLNGGTSTRR